MLIWFIFLDFITPFKKFNYKNTKPKFTILTILYYYYYLNYLFILLYNIVSVLPYWPEYAMGVHVFPILKPPPNSRPIPLGHPSAPAPSILYHPLNLEWRFISHMIIYMFQCHSPISSCPRPLPQSPKDCSIRLCLSCCLTYRVIITIFLNSIYMR